MAVTSCKEAKEHANLTAGIGNKDEWDAPYIVTVDSARDDGRTIVDYLASIGLDLGSPFAYGDRYETTTVLKSIAPVRRANSLFVWDVTLHYAPLVPPDQEDHEDDDGNPTDDPVDYRWDISSGTQFFQTPVYQAWNYDPFPDGGVGSGWTRPALTLGPIHNSAGIILDPPLLRETPETVVRITGNHNEFWMTKLWNYVGRLSWEMIGWSEKLVEKYGFHEEWFQPYCVVCSEATAVYRRENGISFWQYTYGFRIRERANSLNPQDGFLESVLDRGISRLAKGGSPDGAGGTISAGDIEEGMAIASPIKDWQGERVPELIMFDGHGQPLQSSDTNAAPPVYFRWIIHPKADFTFLPLDIFRA